MRLTKDEARILAICLNEEKYDLVNNASNVPGLMDQFDKLEEKLSSFGKDGRRNGRTSLNDYSDLLKRFKTK